MSIDVLVVEDLTKSYGRRPVLCGVSLRVPPGRIVGIEGENGAGKSTLLRCVVGEARPDAGRVVRRGRLGYCPQAGALPETLTAREVLRLFAAGYGMTARAATERTATLAAVFRCEHSLDERVARLSGGTQQKVNLMSALLHDPHLLVLDEPYQGFDHETYLAFWDFAHAFRDAGGSVVVVSHLLTGGDHVDDLLRLRAGRVTAPAVAVGS
ncbi:MAG TPA: ABC transporter ATP-binding protein [Mycobacteriales bacterium]|nr:ABC transporter ATP-binding protein [Mycobacteriales bacterium]